MPEEDKLFCLTINCENDAFHPDPTQELVRILREVAKRLERGESFSTFQTLHDVNGNDVGRAALKPKSKF
jgi:hypothetical protein